MLNKQNIKQLINLSLKPEFLRNLKHKTKSIVLRLLAHIKYGKDNPLSNNKNSNFNHIITNYKGVIFDRINFNKIFNNTEIDRFVSNK